MIALCIKIASIGICLTLLYLIATRIAAVRSRRNDTDTGSDASKRPWYQFSLRTLLALVVVFCLFLTAGLFIKRGLQAPIDAYKQWAMGNLVVEYMEANNGAWPESWEDLQATHESLGGGPLPGNETIASLEQTVTIDFDFDPALASAAITKDASEPGFRVIRLKNGTNSHYVGDEPNKRVFDFLKTRKFESRKP